LLYTGPACPVTPVRGKPSRYVATNNHLAQLSLLFLPGWLHAGVNERRAFTCANLVLGLHMSVVDMVGYLWWTPCTYVEWWLQRLL